MKIDLEWMNKNKIRLHDCMMIKYCWFQTWAKTTSNCSSLLYIFIYIYISTICIHSSCFSFYLVDSQDFPGIIHMMEHHTSQDSLSMLAAIRKVTLVSF